MKKLLSLILAITVTVALTSCARHKPSPADIVAALTAAEASLPEGRLYSSSSREGEDGFLPPEMLSAAYGFPADFDGLESVALRLSSFCHPCEFAIFLCRDHSAAEDVALFCRVRLSILRGSVGEAASFCGMTAEKYLEYLDSAVVIVSGRLVSLIISSDTAMAKKAFYSVL